MPKRSIIVFLWLCLCLMPAAPSQGATITFNRYAQGFYDRYALQFDRIGLQYSDPSYGVKDFTAAGSPRDLMLISNYYLFRAQRHDQVGTKIIRQTIFTCLDKLASPLPAQSFGYSQAMFLAMTTLDDLPLNFSNTEKKRVYTLLAKRFPEGVHSTDTENRALISGSHLQYVANRLHTLGYISEKSMANYNRQLKTKIDQAIKATISKNGWYREGKNFSTHYHVVAAYNLLAYSAYSHQPAYQRLASRMYWNIRNISFGNGMVEATIGHRPIGLGAQFYTMMGVLGTAAQDRDAGVYFSYARGDKFFSDPTYPNRLEFHRTVTGAPSYFHDDIAFSDIVIMAQRMPAFPAQSPLNLKSKFSSRALSSNDTDFSVSNNGRRIHIVDKKVGQVIEVTQNPNGLTSILTRRKI